MIAVSAHSIPLFLLTDADLPFVLLHCRPPGSADLTAFRRRWQDGSLGITGATVFFFVPCSRGADKRKVFSLLWDWLRRLLVLISGWVLARHIIRNSLADMRSWRWGRWFAPDIWFFYPQPYPVVFFQIPPVWLTNSTVTCRSYKDPWAASAR